MGVERLLLVYLLSMAPTFEGRYAVVAGVAMGLSPMESLAASLLGVATVAVLLPLALDWLDRLLRGWGEAAGLRGRVAGLYLRVVERTRIRAGPRVKRYGLLGLFIFVALPLPGTGVWTGALAAFLLGIPRARSVPVLVAGGWASTLLGLGAALLGWRIAT